MRQKEKKMCRKIQKIYQQNSLSEHSAQHLYDGQNIQHNITPWLGLFQDPLVQSSVTPVCLPWTSKNPGHDLKNVKVNKATITGWGAITNNAVETRANILDFQASTRYLNNSNNIKFTFLQKASREPSDVTTWSLQPPLYHNQKNLYFFRSCFYHMCNVSTSNDNITGNGRIKV